MPKKTPIFYTWGNFSWHLHLFSSYSLSYYFRFAVQTFGKHLKDFFVRIAP